MSDLIKKNYEGILKEIENIRGKNSGVRVVAASKYVDANGIIELMNAGVEVLGENRVQAMRDKREVLEAQGIADKIKWDFIGNLQKNKIKYIINYVDLIQAVHEFSLLEELDKKAKANGRVLDVLLEVNISGEESKHGFEKEDILNLGKRLVGFSNLKVKGLMTMAPNTEDTEIIRAAFRGLREFKNQLNDEIFDGQLTELSMGMSNDYIIALEEGATIIRIGSKLFN